MTRKLTPLFVLALITLALTYVSVFIIATVSQAALDRDFERRLNPPRCVDPTGHYERECPDD